MGKIPKSVGGHEYLFVAIDKFTKWVEVMPVPRQTAQAAIKFIEGIVYRFGVPNRIITDNGSQFTSRSFLNFCEELQKLDNMNKLSSKWEGPYLVTHTLRPGAVYLEDEKGRSEGNAWNIENLRKFNP